MLEYQNVAQGRLWKNPRKKETQFFEMLSINGGSSILQAQVEQNGDDSIDVQPAKSPSNLIDHVVSGAKNPDVGAIFDFVNIGP